MIIFQVGENYFPHVGKPTPRAILSAAKRLSNRTIIWKEVSPDLFEKLTLSISETGEKEAGHTMYVRKLHRIDLSGTGEMRTIKL